MNTVIVVLAQYVPFLVPLAAGVVWLTLDRTDKISLAIRAIIAFALALVLIKVAGMVHTDPRPFVVDPSLKPLFPHPADNGFPSDHTTMVVTVSLLVLAYRRWTAIVLLVVSALVGWARVASHVHHTEDIIAGAVIGIVAALVGYWAERAIARRRAAHAVAAS